MNFDELIRLLNNDIPKVLDILDDVFEEDGVYIDLCKEWESPSNNFSLPNYRGRLVRYVKRNKRVYNSFKKEIEKDAQSFQQAPTDKIYELLCHLDFKHQSEYFDAIINSRKNVIPFIIRGNKSSGQKWLYNRLIYTYQQKQKDDIHEIVTLDSEYFQSDIKELLKTLISTFGGSLPDDSDILDIWFFKLRESIKERIRVAHQIIIFKNASTFVQSDKFANFTQMLERVFLQSSNHKCILFFVEEKETPYKIANCIYTSEKEVYEINLKLQEQFSYIDLNKLSPVTVQCVKTWFGKVPEIYDIKPFIDKVEEIIEQYKGNPELLIPFLCKEIIKEDYLKYENQWLKY
jgi:hypothetical protein